MALQFDILARDRASKTLRDVGDAADKSGRRISAFAGGVVGGALAVATGAVAGFAASSVKAGATFDSTMRQIASVTGGPAAELKKLSALSLKFGADTKFSAQEAGQAILELAKGGLTTAQIRAGALKATLTLAAAGGLELGNAATFVSNGLNTFGLRAGEAGSVAAALAGGANASSASVESLGTALQQVGPGAKNAGLSLQETVAALAAFDNAGIKGSDAGTSLKTMLARLVPTTDAAKTAMKRLGLDFTDATGAFLPLRDIAGQLQRALGRLSEEQRTVALTTIFGSDATRAASVLANVGAAGIERYTAATSDQAAAQRIASAAMQGTAGALESLKGSIETIKIQLGVALGPAVAATARFLTESLIPAVTRLGGFLSTHLGPVLGSINAAMRVFFDTVTGRTDSVTNFEGKLRTANQAGTQLVWVFRDHLIPAFRSVVGFIRANVLPVLTSLASFISTRIAPVVADLYGRVLAGLRAALETVSRKINENRAQLAALGTAILAVVGFVATKLGPVLGTVFVTSLRTTAAVIGAIIGVIGGMVRAFQRVHSIVSSLIERVKDLVSALKKVKPPSFPGSGLLGKIPGFASGGVLPRGLAVVGERGPELVVSRGGSRVIPNHQLGGIPGTPLTINVYGSVVTERELVEVVRTGLVQTARRNGGSALAGFA